jgi:hypothetical protein
MSLLVGKEKGHGDRFLLQPAENVVRRLVLYYNSRSFGINRTSKTKMITITAP